MNEPKKTIIMLSESLDGLAKNMQSRHWFPNMDERRGDIRATRQNAAQLLELVETETFGEQHSFILHTVFRSTIKLLLNHEAVLPVLTHN